MGQKIEVYGWTIIKGVRPLLSVGKWVYYFLYQPLTLAQPIVRNDYHMSKPSPRICTVVRTETISPHMKRITVTAPANDAFPVDQGRAYAN